MMKKALAVFSLFLVQALSFAPSLKVHRFATDFSAVNWDKSAAIASIATITTAVQSAGAVDDYEIADLPPPYVPVAFGFLLIVGVGVLTGSLGNVMDEEASLGLQSGARAKKEMQRSKSSYFKKR